MPMGYEVDARRLLAPLSPDPTFSYQSCPARNAGSLQFGKDMELFQVRYFLALAKSLNFTRAAEACHVSQPALTRAIQRLEEELGGPLLYRERNLTQLTTLGQAMLPHLQAAHDAAEMAAAQAAAFQRRGAPALRLGIDGTLSAELLAPALRALLERAPDFEFALTEGPTPEILERLRAGELDGALLVEREKPPQPVDRWHLFHDPYVLLCPAGHPFARLDAVPAQALAGECIVVRTQPQCDFQQGLERLCAAAGVKPKAQRRCSGEDQIQQMVSAGLGVALSAAHRRAGVGIVARPLADPGAGRDVALAALGGREHGPSLTGFLKLMRARDWSELNMTRH
jgi:DNA-binding transcriptional LysR family regulator